jgi:SWI/SNF related-matrix-associated actin-dependent regulator of chromatin subfamily C
VAQVRGAHARIHWLHKPDSYDEWVPASATPGVADPPRRPPGGPWHVNARWLLDSERYNEWMNPADYETPEAAEEAKRKRAAGEEDAGRKVGQGSCSAASMASQQGNRACLGRAGAGEF